MRYAWALPAFLFAFTLHGQVKITHASDRIRVEIDGKPFTDFFTSSTFAKPYLHPLRTASGKVITRSYPMETIEGEAKDHPHHRGLWFTHGDVNGIDFWANEANQKGVAGKKGTVVTRKISDIKGGKKNGLIAANFDWVGPDGQTILSEARRMTFHSHPTLRIMDFDITLTAVQRAVFGDTKEGTFAIRLGSQLQEEKGGTGRMVSAEGREGEKAVWGTRSPWVDYAGTLEGERVGVAIFDHPSNPKHPTYWHSRGYGLFAANIFGEHDFLRDKTKNGSVTLEPGQTMRFRYQVVIHPGNHTEAGLADLYKKFAQTKDRS